MDVPLTPIVVDVVTFDRAPLGRRGYNEDQVDDFLDRVQATLAGRDNLTAADVRQAEFDAAPFIRRGYHEDQVDEFLDLVVEELSRREGAPADTKSPAPASSAGPATPAPGTPVAWVPFPAAPRPVPPPTPAEQTNPMVFSLPPSLPSPGTQPLTRAAAGPPNPSVAASTDNTGPLATAAPSTTDEAGDASVAAGQAASAFRAGSTSALDKPPAPKTLADYAPKHPPLPEPTPEPASELAVDARPAFPFPPAPPGEPGYVPADVARLANLLANSPDREQLATLTFAVTTTGGYHRGTVDALRQAWLDALATKRP